MSRIKWLRWVLGLAVVAVAVVVLGLLLAPRPVPVDTDLVRTGPIADSVADQGTTRVREAYVVSAPVSGRLERLDLHVGDRIVAGRTIVARIRPASAELLDPRARAQAQAAVAAAVAAVASSQAQGDQLAAEARRARLDLDRTRSLAAKGFASTQVLDAAETQSRMSEAGVRAAAAQLAVRRSELTVARAALIGPEAATGGVVSATSPASGYITRVLQESERTVPAGAPLVEVSDQSGLEAAIEFLSQDAVRIREGMTAEVFDWGGGAPIPAIVRRVEPQGFTKISALGVEEQRVLVLLQLTGDRRAWATLGPGYRLWGRVFLRQEADALKAPLGALVRKDGHWAVFRVSDGRAQLTLIAVGALTDREVEVRKGLKAGDRIVVFPSDKVDDGVQVAARAKK
ncbi:efflux RND transporter periplasmic adaptor subunit [Caulobacter vibrioides]|uniref:efflux RND transporter periplasmic adaptor subunit n=1 Tax=Caulobacter vibrioides TaxID=155892 RepID=UPI000BB5092C|nr:HlyD family efflux transporter periplasmic adaptor subunit [Caulobacter vibrioides]ATC28487.1 efflux transporter periplasmic adaptor subunit [Caulobacter vibrioides]